MKKLTRRTVCVGLMAVPAAALAGNMALAGRNAGPAPFIEPTQGDIIERIVAVVARHDGVTAELMRSPERTWIAVNARRKAMYLSFRMSRKSLPEIGRRFGGRDHTTVLHAIRAVYARARRERSFMAELEELAIQADPRADVLFVATAERLRRAAG